MRLRLLSAGRSVPCECPRLLLPGFAVSNSVPARSGRSRHDEADVAGIEHIVTAPETCGPLIRRREQAGERRHRSVVQVGPRSQMPSSGRAT